MQRNFRRAVRRDHFPACHVVHPTPAPVRAVSPCLVGATACRCPWIRVQHAPANRIQRRIKYTGLPWAVTRFTRRALTLGKYSQAQGWGLSVQKRQSLGCNFGCSPWLVRNTRPRIIRYDTAQRALCMRCTTMACSRNNMHLMHNRCRGKCNATQHPEAKEPRKTKRQELNCTQVASPNGEPLETS